MSRKQNRTGPAPVGGVAARLARIAEPVLAGPLPVRLRAWDGSEAGPADAPVLEIRSRRALRRLLWSPNEIGLARAYVTGELEVEGPVGTALSEVKRTLSGRTGIGSRAAVRRALRPALVEALRSRVLGPAPAAPPEEARLRGRLHSVLRDRAAISHHYDLGNDFYELLLDETMAYSCGYWAQGTGMTDVESQRAKLDLVCRKLDLQPGQTLLDVGCGWGATLLHAAEHYGVHAIGYTISREQAAFVRERARLRGLEDRVEVRLQDYREIDLTGVDAVSTLEMGEHVGLEQYPAYTGIMFDALRPGGRLLLQQMSRGHGGRNTAAGGGPFIESYIAPDMHMRPLSQTLGLIHDAGFEIRDVEALREHYVLTVQGWADTLERRWDDVVALAGERTARVWRLYLAGGGLAFAENRMGVDQVLAVRPHADGTSDVPLDRPWARPTS